MARYSYLDLDEKDIQGGILHDWTFGTNWYLNPNARVMLNYVYSYLENVGDAHIFQMRFQVAF